MRTTINIQEHLLREAKAKALSEERTLGEFIEDAIRENLERRSRGRNSSDEFRPLPTFRGDGVREGVDLSDSAALADLMDGN